MANIQMTDRNPSELGIMEVVEELLDEELTNKELEAINGGSYNPPRTSAWTGAWPLD
jgi:bacteriocin-like protein